MRFFMSRFVVCGALLLAMSCGEHPAGPAAPFTVLTYNVNYTCPPSSKTRDAIIHADADVVCLQETTRDWFDFLVAGLADQYPHHVMFDHNDAGGLAVFTKRPLIETQKLPPAAPGGWFPACLLVADTPAGRVQILSVHLRPMISDSFSPVAGFFTTPAVRRHEVEVFSTKLKPGMPTLVLGDFNDQENGKCVKFFKEQGYVDTLTLFDPKTATCHHVIAGINIGTRLDHILYSSKLRPLAARVVREGESDHDAVWAKFDLAVH